PQTEQLNPLAAVEQLLQQLAIQSKQQRVTDLAQELRRYNQLLVRYREQLLRLQQQVCQVMLQQTQQAQPDSLTALHALWVDHYEHAYQRLLQQPDYQRLYGDLINSGMRLQQLGQRFWQDEYRMAGLVPRQDYDQLLQQHHTLRKQLRRSQRANARIDERLAQLEQQLEQVRINTEQRLGQMEGAQVALVRKRKA
ncbi:MAG TPA: poly(R)-hydroxyalkanoic acid synthase subunit PhaE, partial [Motiliproteus sp.]